MNSEIIKNLEQILTLPEQDFDADYRQVAFDFTRKTFGNKAFLTGILALSNYCVNDCRYCGLRSQSEVNRFRLNKDRLIAGVDYLQSLNIKRLFLISGEDPQNDISVIADVIRYASGKGFHVGLGAGVFEKDEIAAFKQAGADEFCLKFESSDRELFRAVKPSTDFDRRIRCIEDAADAGFEIATGGIIGLHGQTLKQVADDIKYTVSFNPSWIPLVPYLPAPGTPMAENTPPGDVELTLRAISLLRLLLPESRITAGQPKAGSKMGFADPEGNAAAVRAGANIFFIDATPAVVREDFSIVGGRALAAYDNIMKIFADNGLEPV